jgi:hypothetical protein
VRGSEDPHTATAPPWTLDENLAAEYADSAGIPKISAAPRKINPNSISLIGS